MTNHKRNIKRRVKRRQRRRVKGITKSVATLFVTSVVNDVLNHIKVQYKNNYPISWCMKYAKYCYVCEKYADVYSVRADNAIENYGWLACNSCLPLVERVFRPLYSQKQKMICIDSLLHLLGNNHTFMFTRRSKTLINRSAYIENCKIRSVNYRSKRINAWIYWEEGNIEYSKCVTLANIIRTDSSFPQTLQKCLRLLRKGNTVITPEFIDMLIKEYLFVDVWRFLERRLNSDVLSIYGWYSDD